MGKINEKIHNISLRKSLIYIFIIFVVCTTILAIVTIFISVKVQRYVLDSRTLSFEVNDENVGSVGEAFYEINEQYQWSELTPKQMLLYYGSIVGMTLFIIVYILAGGLLAGNIYYKIKLKKPLEILKNGISNITAGNLDFSINYSCNDELGLLCGAVEKMVQELIDDKKRIWLLLDDRRTINASISHDLGTPITVIKGYLEFLKKNISEQNISYNLLIETLDNMNQATSRMEGYIESVRNIQRIDDIEIVLKEENLTEIFMELQSDLKKLAEKYNKELIITNHLDKVVCIDKIQFFRIIENIVINSLGYAERLVIVGTSQVNNYLRICVKDDGFGFSPEDIENATKLFYTKNRNKKNMGLGLYISKLLCEKQGGKLFVKNSKTGGGEIIIQIKIKVD